MESSNYINIIEGLSMFIIFVLLVIYPFIKCCKLNVQYFTAVIGLILRVNLSILLLRFIRRW